jgi:hypothetical protein
MPPLSRWERQQLAVLRLRAIQNEAAAIYRSFPELDRRPKIRRAPVRTKSRAELNTHAARWLAKFH